MLYLDWLYSQVVIIGWKYLPSTNTLAYFAIKSVTKRASFETLTTVQKLTTVWHFRRWITSFPEPLTTWTSRSLMATVTATSTAKATVTATSCTSAASATTTTHRRITRCRFHNFFNVIDVPAKRHRNRSTNIEIECKKFARLSKGKLAIVLNPLFCALRTRRFKHHS